ncbi:hypothetical protein [Pseudomonas syringae]|uniref:hypothetical protein n=1 Tax=Pseudomonas syringae TaxID=317 RepID=UPI001F3E22E8|nr:hypothetical protein [Pseudomonas syringae]MCF5721502.1 hypothetical protein [Pseudomonas syringae]
MAIRDAHHELKSRMYEDGLYRSGLIGGDNEDDEFYILDFEDDEEDQPHLP